MSTSRVESRSTMADAIHTAHRYHDWVFASFGRYVQPRTALEVGAGHGMYSRRIAARVDQLVVSDIDPEAVDRMRLELKDVDNVRLIVMDGIEPKKLNEKFDNIILVNLLEHIDDDRDFVSRCYGQLNPGGRLILFVPAFPMLYGNLDRRAGHFRRYRRREVSELLADAGFRVLSARYFNAVGFFGWLANKLTRSDVNSASTNAQVAAFDRLVPVFKRIDFLLPCLGQSLVVVGSKENQ